MIDERVGSVRGLKKENHWRWAGIPEEKKKDHLLVPAASCACPYICQPACECLPSGGAAE